MGCMCPAKQKSGRKILLRGAGFDRWNVDVVSGVFAWELRKRSQDDVCANYVNEGKLALIFEGHVISSCHARVGVRRTVYLAETCSDDPILDRSSIDP